MGVADEAATMGISKTVSTEVSPRAREAAAAAPRSIAERAEHSIELISRWAGILAFVGALGIVAYLIL